MNAQPELITRFLEYNLWANMQLLKLCSTLTEEQLQTTVKGVVDSLQPTLTHLIRSEAYLINRMSGASLWDVDPDWDNLSVLELIPLAKLTGERLIELAGKVDPDTRHDVERRGASFRFFNWTVLLQALYHGIEHRTHTKILLTHIGVPHPELASWDYTAHLQVQGLENCA